MAGGGPGQTPVKIVSVEAYPVRLPRDLGAATGLAGSPTQLAPGRGRYKWSEAYPTLYPTDFETALVRIRTDTGLTGWGEAQAPLAPEVACAIIEHLLVPVLVDTEFSGSPAHIADFWDRMYSTMRVRGQTGGFMLDAISGVDIALWDLAGKTAGKPVSALIAREQAKPSIPAYLSGLVGDTVDRRIEFARKFPGFDRIKLYLGRDVREILATMDGLREEFGPGIRVGVDALWHLSESDALAFGRELDRRKALWLECPLLPEDPVAHGKLARAIRTPIALGESYRTRYELAPFFRERAVGLLQPDIGRTGITEGLRLASMAAAHGVAVVPHVSIALGPQIAAAIHFAAAVPNCQWLEYNPAVFDIANRFLRSPLQLEARRYITPTAPGLGVEVKFEALHLRG